MEAWKYDLPSSSPQGLIEEKGEHFFTCQNRTSTFSARTIFSSKGVFTAGCNFCTTSLRTLSDGIYISKGSFSRGRLSL